MSYLVDEFKVGVNSFLILIVVIFEIILVSVSSIKDVTLEYLNTPSNFCKVLSLKFDNTEVISDFKVAH